MIWAWSKSQTQNAYSRQTAQRLASIQYGLSSCKESLGTIPPFCIITCVPHLVFMHLTVHIGPQLLDSFVNNVWESCGSYGISLVVLLTWKPCYIQEIHRVDHLRDIVCLKGKDLVRAYVSGCLHGTLLVELRLIDNDGNELSDWFAEETTVGVRWLA